MPILNVEHIAWNVADPAAVADWYVSNLGMRVFRSNHLSFRLDVTNNVVWAGASRIINIPTIQLATALNFGATE